MPADSGYWTPERVETLKRLYAEGLTSGQIRDEMGAESRNVIIGKIERLGLNKSPESIEKRARRVPVKRALRPHASKGSSHKKMRVSKKTLDGVKFPSEPFVITMPTDEEVALEAARQISQAADCGNMSRLPFRKFVPAHTKDRLLLCRALEDNGDRCTNDRLSGLAYCDDHRWYSEFPNGYRSCGNINPRF